MKFETQFTYDFIKRSVPVRAHRVLEIGCGFGELAASLIEGGFSVVAIDSDAGCVQAAQQLGVDARVAAWPDFDDGQFDVVLFTRSLHHIRPLDGAVLRAADSLGAGGRLIVKDFAYEMADEKTLCWFAEIVDRFDDAGLLVKEGDFLSAVRSKIETIDAWLEKHESHLHSAAAILAEIQKVFGKAKREEAPYYFRYLASAIVPTSDRDRILQELAGQEASLISKGAIRAIGRRFVAERL